MERACRFLADRKPTSPETSQAMRWLAERHPKVVEHLLGMPRTIIHGEFYASNVLIDGSDGDISMWPIDWEMAAVGPAVIDLAALTSGAWTAHERRSMIAAYAAGRNVEAIARDVDYALVHLAVQWLGWFGRRRPPADHARDWLGEAVHRAEALEL
jgi:thiamine kinase-like enzyme